MNRLHNLLCRSGHWRKVIQERVPWVLSGSNLGPDVLELGPGPGLTTDLLKKSVPRLSHNVDIAVGQTRPGDATGMPSPDGHFTGGVSFTMLHHVPSPQLQDKLLREVWRVLHSGGIFVGSDSIQSLFMRLIHIGDTLVPIDPDKFGIRLEAAGFEVLEIEKRAGVFRFQARKPV